MKVDLKMTNDLLV